MSYPIAKSHTPLTKYNSTELIVPAGCKPDIDENVPESVKGGIEFVFVEDVRQVLHEAFRGTEVEKRWQETLPMEEEPQRERH